MAKVTDYEEEVFFQYPGNIGDVELASMILLYRSRGEVVKATPSTFFCCSLENRLIKQAKDWFGKSYSQSAWDRMLTNGSKGYPLTPHEMHLLGYAATKKPNHQFYLRNEVSRYLQLPESFCYVLMNDLEQFGFLQQGEQQQMLITDEGEKALQGISRRIFKKRYREEFLPHISGEILPENPSKLSKSASKSGSRQQSSLF